MKHSAFYRYLLLLLLSFSISGTMFFYSSSIVHASDLDFILSSSKSTSSTSNYRYLGFPEQVSNSLFFPSYYEGSEIDPDAFYRVNFTLDISYSWNTRLYYFSPFIYLNAGDFTYLISNDAPEFNADIRSFDTSSDVSVLIKGIDLAECVISFDASATSTSSVNASVISNYIFSNVSVDLVNSGDSITVEDAYNNGFSAGWNVGNEDGFRAGYDSGYSTGLDKGFGDGYQEGLFDGESIGYQNGYDSGYSIGYSEAFEIGYNSGYSDGYNYAMERIESWGADGSDYPLLVSENSFNDSFFNVGVYAAIPFKYSDQRVQYLDYNFDPNHTYKFTVNISDVSFVNSNCYHSSDRFPFFLNIGGIDYILSGPNYTSSNYFYIPGDRMSNTFAFVYSPICVFNGDDTDVGSSGAYVDFSYSIYDMGPAGNLQNQIANQTDDLTNGFDTNDGNAVNDDLSNSLDSYHDQENSIFTSVKSGLDDFKFYNFEDSPALIAGITFVSSIMTSWFNASGGLGGVGILLSVLFSIMIASMALGLYRYYQSRGKGGKGK